MLKAHLFICTNGKNETPDPNSGKSRCGWKNSEALRLELKDHCSKLYGKSVRINGAGCLGQCEKGIASVLYPQGRWVYHLSSDSAEQVLQQLAEALPNKGSASPPPTESSN
ncbi:MAG: (2Fe-2S) ferredoxin domain-containing protein [Bdellovibrio sp.]